MGGKKKFLIITFMVLGLLGFGQEHNFELLDATIKSEVNGTCHITFYEDLIINNDRLYAGNDRHVSFFQNCTTVETLQELESLLIKDHVYQGYGQAYIDGLHTFRKSTESNYELDSKYEFTVDSLNFVSLKYILHYDSLARPIYALFRLCEDLRTRDIWIDPSYYSFADGITYITANSSRMRDLIMNGSSLMGFWRSDTLDWDMFVDAYNFPNEEYHDTLQFIEDTEYSVFSEDTLGREQRRTFTRKNYSFNFRRQIRQHVNGWRFKRSYQSKKQLSERYGLVENLFSHDTLSLLSYIELNSIPYSARIFKFYNHSTIVSINNSYSTDFKFYDYGDLFHILVKLDFRIFSSFRRGRFFKSEEDLFRQLDPYVDIFKLNKGILDLKNLKMLIEDSPPELGPFLTD